MRKGMGMFDPSILKDQQDAILKGLNNMDEEINLLDQNRKDPFEGKTMQDVLKEKREATEKILESTKIN
jgi:hypothetical protein